MKAKINYNNNFKLNPINIQILWNRLITIVDEAATGLIRTAYTPSVKEYHDFCCALFDANAQMLSHSTITTAGFLGIVPEVMKNFLKEFPANSLKPGDVLITNDPWIASGHLIDISVASPIFYRNKIVGYTLCIVHHLDMGGRMSTLESKDVFEEGLKIPILKLYNRGKLNKTIFEFIKANLRVPDKVLGDVRAQLVANNVCTKGLQNLLKEYNLIGLEELGAEVIDRTEKSLRHKIKLLPDGSYRNDVVLPLIPGCNDKIEIKTLVTVSNDEIIIDYTGSSGEIRAAVNCSYNMTRSYTSYPIKLALDPTIPNNDGGLRPIKIVAPEGSIVNSRPPAATWGRTMISHLFPEIIFAAMAKIIPSKILASNGGSPANEMYLHGKAKGGRSFLAISQHSGGYGASELFDGHPCLCFPNNTSNIPIEVTENEANMYYIKKEFLVDSGGPGKNRGGLGQEVEFCILDNKEQDNYVETSVRLSGRTEKGTFPVSGMMGGQKGRGSGMWIDGKEVDHGIYRRLKPNSVVKFIISGGGGFGDSYKRDPSKVLNDVKKGYVSIIAAKRDYGVIIDKKTLTLNKQSTAKLRKQKNVQK